ncbi:unnamed protein product [Paramecium pentaurelia]|uniref:Uncharacterized protein n=1 Tax=Paramecium pentaurelia TaxID=43138 RepID=A0A8S1U897_9CILI|nr:unnamed protein product [Paramecium pentaurelia]
MIRRLRNSFPFYESKIMIQYQIYEKIKSVWDKSSDTIEQASKENIRRSSW